MVKNNERPELATFTLLNPDFHTFSGQTETEQIDKNVMLEKEDSSDVSNK